MKHGWWDTWGWRGKENEGGKTQASRRDKAIDLHCQSGEAINNSVTIKRETGRVWRSESRVYKRNTTKPGATGASSCRALMGVRSGWLSILCLTAHSSLDGPWHPWRSATHLFNPVYTLEGHTMVEVQRWRAGERRRERLIRRWERWSKVIPNLDVINCSISLPPSCTSPPHFPSLSSALPALFHYSCHSSAIFPISSATLASSEGKKVTQTVYFPGWSWGGQSWDTRPTEDCKSAVSGYIKCVCKRDSLCVWQWKVRVMLVTAVYSYDLAPCENLFSKFLFHFCRTVSF